MTEPPAARLTAAEIAGEIERTRTRLARDLAHLDRDYALRHLAVRAVRLARNPEIEVKRIKDALRLDAAPIALIGLGIAWLSLAGRGGGELLQRLTGGLAALQRLAAEFSKPAETGEAPAPAPTPPPLPPPDAAP